MKSNGATSWTLLAPRFRAARYSKPAFVRYARQLARMSRSADERDNGIDAVQDAFVETTKAQFRSDRQALLAAGFVLTDLVRQRWSVRIRRGSVEVRAPETIGADVLAEKKRVREQELVGRNAQLRKPSVQKFVGSMEKRRLHRGRFVSIFSLMRDGRNLAEQLRRVRNDCTNGSADSLASVIDPYLQFVSDDERCEHTGLRLMDIWRYFRHTWTNPYSSAPGRGIMFLVRDRAAPLDPVMGIGSLSSPIVQIRERDAWIGWHSDSFIEAARAEPTSVVARWLKQVVDTGIEEIYLDDFLEDGLLDPALIRKPNVSVIERLVEESAEQRRLHHRYARSQDHKRSRGQTPNEDHWTGRARTNLFRSKRALALADCLEARMILNQHFGGTPTTQGLITLLSTGAGADVVSKIVKRAKARRIGIAMADISVCGAVQPYNALLGGKLVSMLTTSPEVILFYKQRYSDAESEIASSVAGRAIVRPANLVLLGTTSLYSAGSSQYNRVRIPAEILGGIRGDQISYEKLGCSEAFGTSHYSDDTVLALATLVQQTSRGQRVNSIFGEGVSPKLRKVREGLDLLEFPSDLLLRHHRRRIVYAITLVRNTREYLLGIDPQADYIVPMNDAAGATRLIADWWRQRWLSKRIQKDEVLDEIARHTLVHPITHGARVDNFRVAEATQGELFSELH